MSPSAPGRFRRDDNGQRLEVETATRGVVGTARLFVDGEPVAERTTWLEAARLDKLERDHPRLYAARHVAIAAFQLLIGLVGIGAIVRGLLPNLPIPVPDVAVPGWVRTVFGWYDSLTAVPVGWVRSIAEWVQSAIAVPGWVGTILQSAK